MIRLVISVYLGKDFAGMRGLFFIVDIVIIVAIEVKLCTNYARIIHEFRVGEQFREWGVIKRNRYL